jgi:hypothetical protein
MYLVPVNHSAPDTALGYYDPKYIVTSPHDFGYIVSVPELHDQVALEVAFDVPGRGRAESKVECEIELLSKKLMGQNDSSHTTYWDMRFHRDHKFSVYQYAPGGRPISLEDTWNNHPVVDFSAKVAEAVVCLSLLS